MLIGRAPVRISFGGGGTDLQDYYMEYGGLVISATINKYVYGILTPNPNGHCQIISADYQRILGGDPRIRLPAGELKLAKAVLGEFGAPYSTNVFLASEVPPGTGLGSSGAAAVNLINILATLYVTPLSRQDMAELAYRVEVGRLGAPIGKQDQYASAYGGINCIKFSRHRVAVEPLRLPEATVSRLQRNLVLFFTGNSRSAWDILRAQQEATRDKAPMVLDALHHIKRLAVEMKKALETGDLQRFGQLLDESWQLKKRLSPIISNALIDDAYTTARLCGALGGKITGAGGGGCLVFYCEEEAQPELRRALRSKGLQEMEFGFEFEGARTIMNTSSPAWKAEVQHERRANLLPAASARSR